MAYDKNNIFAKIIRGEIPCNKVFENNNALVFHDINPLAQHHILVLPKGEYQNAVEFFSASSAEEKEDFFNAVKESIEILNIKESGYRMVANSGRDGGQEVNHFHLHILGGRGVGGGFIK